MKHGEGNSKKLSVFRNICGVFYQSVIVDIFSMKL